METGKIVNGVRSAFSLTFIQPAWLRATLWWLTLPLRIALGIVVLLMCGLALLVIFVGMTVHLVVIRIQMRNALKRDSLRMKQSLGSAISQWNALLNNIPPETLARLREEQARQNAEKEQ